MSSSLPTSSHWQKRYPDVYISTGKTKILLAHQPVIRLGAFAGVFAAMVLWELLAPWRRQAIGRLSRWPSNLGIVVLDTLLVQPVFPLAAVGVALLAEIRGWGLFQTLEAPVWLAIVAYCRGPYCVLSYEAVALLRARGFTVRRLEDGLPEWRAAGLPVEM